MATARKTENKKSTNERFEKFRDRALAIGAQGVGTVSNDAYVLGEDEGFSPAIELPKPALRARMLAEDAIQRGDSLTVSKIIFGPYVDRVLGRLEEYERETGENADTVLFGLIYDYFEHFYGKGAADNVFPNASN
mgnify:CR=1 FL=1